MPDLPCKTETTGVVTGPSTWLPRANAPSNQASLSGRLLRRLLVCVVALCLASGCSNGNLAFDGGHVPIGGGSGSRIAGVAFVAEDPSIVVPNAVVSVTNLSESGPGRTQTATTGQDGSFVFNKIPDIASVNQYQIVVTPPPGDNLVGQQISFLVNAGAAETVLLALPELSFNQSLPASISITPPSATLAAGDTVYISAHLLDSVGNPLPVTPSLVFSGNFGSINPDGFFTSTTTGSGTIFAYWNTGTVQLQSNATTLVADSVTAHQPPPPPVVSPTSSNSNTMVDSTRNVPSRAKTESDGVPHLSQ